MTAMEYLQQLRNIDISISQDLRRLEAMRISAAGRGAFDYSRDRVQASPVDRLCADVCDIVSFDDRLNARIDFFVDAKELVIEQIRGLHNADYNAVLFYIYVEYKTLKQVAAEMQRSYRWARDKHQEALDAFDDAYHDELRYLT